MKDPGPIMHGSPMHRAAIDYAQTMAFVYGAAHAPMLGLLIKLHEKMCAATQSEYGMSTLVIDQMQEPAPQNVGARIAELEAEVVKFRRVASAARDVRLFAINMPDDVDRGDADMALDEALVAAGYTVPGSPWIDEEDGS